MPEYINHNGFTVHLTGPDGKVVRMSSRQKMVLPDFFERYRVRGFIKYANDSVTTPRNTAIVQAKINLSNKSTSELRIQQPSNQQPSEPIKVSNAIDQQRIILERKKKREEVSRSRRLAKAITKAKVVTKNNTVSKRVVGRAGKQNPNELLKSNLEEGQYPISNNIAVGILSYNRKNSLKRLMDSIVAYTDLRRTTVFISDDASTSAELLAYLDELSKNENVVVIKNKTRLGVAGNSNRLLRCLSRFKNCLLLNDDVEIIHRNWELYYFDLMNKSGFHHFIFREPGVYGANKGEKVNVNQVDLYKVTAKPQGAILAFTNTMIEKCGYFDEQYGLYGMEHVDWSSKVYDFGLQPEGFYDGGDSERYFILHSDVSSVTNRTDLLKQAKMHFAKRTKTYKEPSEESKVPEISYIIPVRDIGRTNSIYTVVNNIRAQKFPVINILLVEQDADSKVNAELIAPINYMLVKEQDKKLFNKSMAFNYAAARVSTDKVILHDADLLARGNYTSQINHILEAHDGCHIGNTVIYADPASTDNINANQLVVDSANCDRIVGYYEGGSLACKMTAYWSCGAFNEDYWGYGCEDCDFYARLSAVGSWYEERTADFLHLWHGRVDGWNEHHDENKRLELSLRKQAVHERIMLQYEQMNRLGYGRFIS
jgi:hypothetical protein